jgi:hypothetical protein
MDYITMAHWIQGRGHITKDKRLYLDTNGFTIKDVILLVNILIIKFDFKCTLLVTPKKSRIYIKGKDLNKIILNIKPYFVISMLYKLDIKQENSYLILNNKKFLYNLNRDSNKFSLLNTEYGNKRFLSSYYNIPDNKNIIIHPDKSNSINNLNP